MKTKLLLFVITFFSVVTSWSQPGQLDLNYNPTGVGAYGGASDTAPCIVYKSRVYTDGPNTDKIIIIGRFTSYNGVNRRYIARLNSNGTLDNTFVSPLTGSGYLYVAEILPDGKILIGGEFTQGTYKNFARLNADGSLDNTFNVVGSGELRGANSQVHALKVMADGRILIGGAFTQFNDVNKRFLRLLADGKPDPTFTSTGTVNGEVRAIEQQGNKILVGGFFSGFTGVSNKNKIVRLFENGDYDSTFNVGGNGATGGTAVFDIKVINNKIYVGGKFDRFNNQTKRAIACLLENGTVDPEFNVNRIGVTNEVSSVGVGSGYNVFSICPQPDGKILLGGNFTEYNDEVIPKGLARIYQDGSRDLSFVTGTGFTGGTTVYEGKSVVRDITLQTDGKIIVGGDFDKYDGVTRRMSARIITRDCDRSVQFTQENGWSDDQLPLASDQLAFINSGTYTVPTGTHLVCCDLRIQPNATLIVAPGASITVHGNIYNKGQFIIEDDGSLVQTNEVATYNNDGTGVFIAKRSTTPMRRYDYTYWSSPVNNFTLQQLSPNTLADKYFRFNSPTNSWSVIPNGNAIMNKAEGYIVRAPQSFSITDPTVYTAQFVGAPNNGIIKTSHPISSVGENKWALVGNPYPSAIEANAFINDPSNSAIEGTLYFWTHNVPLSFDGQYYNYSASDYATYNLTGFVAGGGFSPQTFDGNIAAGQGFFVEANQNNISVTFRNSMRRVNNNQFFRTGFINNAQSVFYSGRSRFWLNLTNDQGAFNQTMVGYLAGATTEYDHGYDGRKFSGNVVSIYSIENDENYTIQARPLPFNKRDVVQIGYSTDIVGVLKISLNAYDGLFDESSVKIYLRDKLLNKKHYIKEGPYEFYTEIGTFNDRFEIFYETKDSLLIAGFNFSPTFGARSNRQMIEVQSLSEEKIAQVQVYNLSGQLIGSAQEVNDRSLLLEGIQPTQSLVLINVTFENGERQTQKVIH